MKREAHRYEKSGEAPEARRSRCLLKADPCNEQGEKCRRGRKGDVASEVTQHRSDGKKLQFNGKCRSRGGGLPRDRSETVPKNKKNSKEVRKGIDGGERNSMEEGGGGNHRSISSQQGDAPGDKGW